MVRRRRRPRSVTVTRMSIQSSNPFDLQAPQVFTRSLLTVPRSRT
jgi:hypothetical protein